jgi:hypothetical protein
MAAPLFLLSAGRSGSTLVQRLLNSYPDMTLWGEHRGFLIDVAASYFRLLEGTAGKEQFFSSTGARGLQTEDDLRRLKDPAQWQAWTNLLARDEYVDLYRNFVRGCFYHPVMGAGHRWGFKEIRYGADDRVIEFLSQLFPDAVFVFLSRHGLDTLASQLTAFSASNPWARILPSRGLVKRTAAWSRQYENFYRWHTSGKIHSYWLVYEEIIANEDAFHPLLKALGKTFGADQRKVLELEEGRGSAFQNQQAVNERWKTLSLPTLLVSDWVMGNVNDLLGYPSPDSIRWFSAIRRRLRGSRPSSGPPSPASVCQPQPASP